MSAAADAIGSEPRDFTFIKPRKRRLTEYEAVSLHQQWEPGGFDQGAFFTLPPDGRLAWDPASTALVHSNWYAFRDPSQQWQRTYVRMQAEQERAIARATEDAAADGAFAALDSEWLNQVLVNHYRVWSFFEYGLFRAFSPAQREALSDVLGNAICFQSFDHMRHAQAVVAHLLAIEECVDGFKDEGAKQRWLENPVYQPARRLVEEMITTIDWAEVVFVTNFLIAPVVSELALGTLVRIPAALQGDPVTPFIVMTAERDRRRNLTYAAELVRMVTADDVPAREANLAVLAGWVRKWQPRVLEAAQALAPVAAEIPGVPVDFAAALTKVLERQRSILAEAGLDHALDA